jgi:flagellar motility protein MotE (MotC chaperone)
MTPPVKYALLGLGGLLLLGGSFVTFAALSGTPLHEVAVLKRFVKAPTTSDDKGSTKGETRKNDRERDAAEDERGSKPLASGTKGEGDAQRPPAHASPTASERRAIDASVGVLGTFMLPSPFSADELSELQKALHETNADAKRRLERIATRERELAEWEHALEVRNGELQEMRALLEKKELELSLREDEVKRDEHAKSAREQQSWSELSKFFSEGDPEELAKKLVLFEPKDAVRILRALDDERASLLVNALPPDKYHSYLQAYRASADKK